MDNFVTQSKPISAGLSKHVPISKGGGVPSIAIMLRANRIKFLTKLANGTLRGVPRIILDNLGLDSTCLLRLSEIELKFLSLVFKKCNLNFWSMAIKDYICHSKMDMIHRKIEPILYEPISSSAELEKELRKMNKEFNPKKIKSISFFNQSYTSLLKQKYRFEHFFNISLDTLSEEELDILFAKLNIQAETHSLTPLLPIW